MPPTPATTKPRVGIEEWLNAGNGFAVMQLHFSADPVKRTAAWKARTSRQMHPRAWRREYEIDWASAEGEPVVPEFEEALHVREVAVDGTLRLLRFWDFGFDSPVVLFAQLTHWDQLVVLRELCPFNTTLKQLIPAAEAIAKDLLGLDKYLGGERATDYTGAEDDEASETDWRFETTAGPHHDRFGRERLPERRTFDAGDPEGYSRKSLGVEAAVMGQHGLRLHTIRPGTATSYQNLRDRFLRTVMVPSQGRQAAILIAPGCRLLRQSLGGAFCRSVLPPYKPKAAHPYKDLVDALRYGNDNLDALRHGADRQLRDVATRDQVETRV